MPYNVCLIGVIVVFFRVKKRRLKVLAALVFAGLYLQSNSCIVAGLYRWWEPSPRNMDLITQKYDVGIVLSGGLASSCTPVEGYYDLERGSDRLLAGFFLYKKGICKKLLLTGADHDALLRKGRGEVQLAKALLVEWGVAPEDIILETGARNTYENAKYTAALLDRAGEGPRNLLITSAYHMRRAEACFRKAGVLADAYPADFGKRSGCLRWRDCIVPEPAAAEAFQKLWREWIGMLMYKIAGYC